MCCLQLFLQLPTSLDFWCLIPSVWHWNSSGRQSWSRLVYIWSIYEFLYLCLQSITSPAQNTFPTFAVNEFHNIFELPHILWNIEELLSSFWNLGLPFTARYRKRLAPYINEQGIKFSLHGSVPIWASNSLRYYFLSRDHKCFKRLSVDMRML